MSEGKVPKCFKLAIVMPLLKKEGLDPDDLSNFQPISNVSLLSKTLVSERLIDHLDVINTLPDVQSAYRQYHSTETVLTKVVSDITMAADSDDVSVLPLLDLSAAFDTVDHSILIRERKHSVGLKVTFRNITR